MKTFLYLIAYTLLLYVTEALICMPLLMGEVLYKRLLQPKTWTLKKSTGTGSYRSTLHKVLFEGVYGGISVTAVRFMYMYLFYVGLFFLGMHYFHWHDRTLQAAVVNCSLYILLCCIYVWMIPFTRTLLSHYLFAFQLIATLASPFLLNNIKYFRGLLELI